MKRITLAAALGALLFVAPSCSEAEAATVAGTYNLDADAVAKDMGLPAEQAAAMKSMMKADCILNADGSFNSNMDMMGQKMSVKGTWTIKDGAVTFNQTHEGETEKKDTSSGAIKDGVLTITQSKDGKDMKLTFKKAEKK